MMYCVHEVEDVSLLHRDVEKVEASVVRKQTRQSHQGRRKSLTHPGRGQACEGRSEAPPILMARGVVLVHTHTHTHTHTLIT